MYDAWAAYDKVAVGTRAGAALRRPARERTLANQSRALSYAAYRAAVDLFPTERRLFDVEMGQLGYDPLDISSVAAGVGIKACDAVLAFRHGDGANQLGDVNGGEPYSDYTDYSPINDVDHVSDPNRWQPLRASLNMMPGLLTSRWISDGEPHVFLAPHWGLVTPFALAFADQFAPDPPAQFGTTRYEQQARDIVALSAGLSDRHKAIALYWADGPHSETPPGHWNLFAQFVSRRDHHSLDQDVKMFFALGNALLDASIAVWSCKRHFDYVRPVTAVRIVYAGRLIEAWAGPGKETQLIPGETFRSYLPTPPFPEYTSGHSAFSATAAEVLRRVTGSTVFRSSYVVRAGSSFVEPGVAPRVNVTLKWTTFEQAATEAGLSRQYAGIHFTDADMASRAMGRKIGRLVWEKALRYFDGSAPPAQVGAPTRPVTTHAGKPQMSR